MVWYLLVQRFEKTYEALEAESVAEKKQLTELHQQRVQSELNEKTSDALDDYMEAIDDNDDVSDLCQTSINQTCAHCHITDGFLSQQSAVLLCLCPFDIWS